MHRLLNIRCVPLYNFHQMTKLRCMIGVREHSVMLSNYSVSLKTIPNYSKYTPVLKIQTIRSQTTTSNPENITCKKKKRRMPFSAKYVELLQVTHSATKETRTKVKKLKAKKLSDFVLKTNLRPTKLEQKKDENKQKLQPIEYQKINMEMFDNATIQSGIYDERPLIFFGKETEEMRNPDKMNAILKSFNNFREIIETINNEHQEEIISADMKMQEDECKDTVELDTAVDHTNIEIVNSKEGTSSQTVKQKQRFKSKIHKTAEHERLAKERALIINLTTYLNVCVTTGLLNRGLNTLLAHRQRYNKHPSFKHLINIDLYNILLHGYAEKGNYEKIKEICEILSGDGVDFNHQTFAATLESLGRLKSDENNISLINKYIKQAEGMGITLNMIVDKSKFLFDQREIVLDAIKRVHPDFEPYFSKPILTYSNPLLKPLNELIECSDNPPDSNIQIQGNEVMNSKRGFTKEQLRDLAREQLRIELEGSVTVESIENTPEYNNTDKYRAKFEELQQLWKSQICAAINRDLNALRTQSRYKLQSYMTYYVYLKALDVNKYADILLKEIRMLAEGSETYSPTIGQLYRELGQKVYMRYQIEQKKRNGVLDKMGEIYSKYCKKLEECNSSDNPRQMWQRIIHENRSFGPSMDIQEIAWPNNVLTAIGRFLYNILMRDVKIDANIMRSQAKTQNLLPAFYTLFRNEGRIVKEEVKPHPILARLLRASRQKTLTFGANLVPMLCPPQPWSSPYSGGYLLTKSELLRLPQQAVQQWARINEAPLQDLYPALDSLNQLASIPWRVNTDILDVILEVFNNGGDDKLDVPQPPSSLPPLPTLPSKNSKLSNEERFQMFRQKMNYRRKQAEMYSLWCDTLYRLSLANHYRDKAFWLPHNMDFRGRVYPIPPHLNHLGSDLARSILIFDQAQPLGTDGFSWLKLHCINLTGMKKRDSIRERLLYAEEVMDDIIDSADRPLTGRKWWTKSEEPWQTLACCMEIRKVMRCPDPAKYMSRFPVHQDGSCNGLQHYAALGRDKSGAVSVNLAPSSYPQDVYSAVAALVEKARKIDADNGLHVAQILKRYVKRKVIKQTVMTTVYGVTRYGARLQIAKQLKDIDDFPKEWVWPASTYLTTKTFESLREMFTSTREIQDWFTECARLISAVCGQHVEWITPLGLPIVQPYNKTENKNMPKSTLKVVEKMSMDMYEKPNVMKQKNAFPPNFIHSLDSSHMMLTSLYCEREGITFISVHDCFWTHACTVPDMNKVCREQFVSLHSQPILEDLSRFLVQKYSFSERDFNNDGSVADLTKQKLNKVLRQVPKRGDFDLEDVLKSVYFFS